MTETFLVSNQVFIIDKEKTGAAARQHRKKLGLTMAQAAKRVHCSTMTLWLLEKGRRHWDKEWVWGKLYAEFLGLEPILSAQSVTVIDDARTGQAAKLWRRERGIRLARVALEIKCSQIFLRDLEAGHKKWGSPMAVKYREALEKIPLPR